MAGNGLQSIEVTTIGWKWIKIAWSVWKLMIFAGISLNMVDIALNCCKLFEMVWKIPPKLKPYPEKKRNGMSKCGKNCTACPLILQGKELK